MGVANMSSDNEAKLRRAAIVLRDMCASNTSSTVYQNHDPELEHEGVDADEVYPGVFIGNMGAAKSTNYLRKREVTHVLNSAEGTRIGTVNASQEFYDPFGIKYKGLKLLDTPQSNISVHFDEVAEFIDDALQGGGRVMVNCLMGMSRSSTCVLAFLMIKRDKSAVEALAQIRQHRDVRPNDGFLRQIAELDFRLRQRTRKD